MNAQNIEAIHALTPLQEGILFHTLEARAPGVYHSQFSCRLEGELDEALFERAWETVVARHGVLRTLFTWERRDKPLQIVRGQVALPWQHFDWRELDANAQARQLDALLKSDRDRGFDLERAPLLRFFLVRVGPHSRRFVFSFHHLVLDGWSMRLVLDEALRIYRALREGRDAALPPAPDFGAFIAWQTGRDKAAQDAFWREHLAGFTTPTTIDVAKAGPARDDLAPGATAEYVIDAGRHRTLSEGARAGRLTLNTLVLGAWSIVLSRYAQRDDVVFGTTVAGRAPEVEGIESMAGLFINTLPLRVRVDETLRCDEFLADLQATSAKQRAFEQTPLVEARRAADIPPGTALFDTIVVFENFPAREAVEPGFDLRDERFDEYSNFPLALLVVPEQALRLLAVYDPGRFDANAVDALLAQFACVLERLARSPERRLLDTPLLPAAERARIVEKFNATQTDLGTPVPVHQLFEAAAAASPDATAVVSGSGRLTCAGLDARANQIARALLARHVQPGQPVVLFAERDTDTVAAVVGVHKAGAAYVPVDPRAPRERLGKIVADLAGERPVVVVTQRSLADKLPAGAAPVLLDDPALADLPTRRPAVDVSADDPAYLMYTSGSTGEPKGVRVSHRALYNSTRARDHHYPERPHAFLVLSSLATDSSLAGLFWSLCTGAALVLPEGRAEQDMEALAALIERERVSHMLCVPSLHALILEHAPREALASLRAVMVAGEACPAGLPARHGAVLPHARLYNEYGPTEATVWASVASLAPEEPITIGRPIANTRLYVLDKSRRPVPVGVTGELYIGGAQIADGYHGHVQATHAAFIADPFVGNGARMYRTGDRARWREDGQLEFLGRADHQIKVRGYRVEPGEIEAALTSYPGVDEAVAFMQETRDDAALARALAALAPAQADAWLARLAALEDPQVSAALDDEPGA